jgi:sterol desaturase/sphingolipid hydroxylase (fatty acid hydroxylase superfamily)
MFLLEFLHGWANTLIARATFIPLELVSDGERQGWVSRLRGVMFLGFYIAGIMIASRLIPVSVKPLLIFDFGSTVSDNLALAVFCVAVLPLIPVLFVDFIAYWFHRLQHAVPLLWRFHSVHHAIEELNVVNSSHHITEGIFRLAFVTVPISLVQFQGLPDIITSTVIPISVAVLLTFTHVNSRISFGPLNYVIVRPLYHRIHHSMNPLHHNKNFCSLFPVWDMLFGTAHFPAQDERIKTGLPDKYEAKTIGQYLFALRSREELVVTSERPDTVRGIKPV